MYVVCSLHSPFNFASGCVITFFSPPLLFCLVVLHLMPALYKQYYKNVIEGPFGSDMFLGVLHQSARSTAASIALSTASLYCSWCCTGAGNCCTCYGGGVASRRLADAVVGLLQAGTRLPAVAVTTRKCSRRHTSIELYPVVNGFSITKMAVRCKLYDSRRGRLTDKNRAVQCTVSDSWRVVRG